MQIFVAILRGINVGGHRIVKMDQLKQIFEDIGLKDAKTYIQSGNVVFRSEITDVNSLAERIRHEILNSTSLDVKTIVIESRDFLERLAANPYLNEGADIQQLHGTFTECRLVDTDPISSLNTKGDTFMIGHQIIYVKCAGSYHTSPLTNDVFERRLKVSCTTRNWKTLTALVTMIEAM